MTRFAHGTALGSDGERMGENGTTPRMLRIATAAIVVMAFGGCATPDDEAPAAETDATADSAVERSVTLQSEPTVPALADPDLNPEGVIFAAIVLGTGGDVDLAMADGMFTRADLDAARAGIADGSLSYLFD